VRDFNTFLAEAIATLAHAGQVDKAGVPYIEHPRAVAGILESTGHGPEVLQAGWLHDVVEDTGVTLDDLRRAGFSETVVSAVDAVTRRGGELYTDLIERAAAHPVGRVVKLADNAHNSGRLDILDEPVRSGLARRYAEARAVLIAAGVPHPG
jgi:(p)ppGpp synthase/HD superfamily hydrolase